MDAIEALKTRRCVRSFKPDPLKKETIEDLIDCGRHAATARNEQPWEFVVVTDPALRKQIADATDFGKFIANAPACVAVLCAEGKYYLEDGAAATQNILVAARAHGLGSCWVAGDKKAYAAEICALLGVPERYRLISLVALGYPAESPNIEKRKLDEVLHWEKF
ncbi:MAG: nitroreductase family protein [Candidatus Hydrogenedentales bacterium]|jgi:nitroreductase